MKVEPKELRGVVVVEGDDHSDPRGRTKKLVSMPMASALALGSTCEVLSSHNDQAGTLRGLHYQVAPFQQTKTLWVSRGSVYDVLVDLRREEPTYGSWAALDLNAQDATCVHVPEGVAHGYQTLEPNTQMIYLIAGEFSAPHARTLRWDDPHLAISWPLEVTAISEADQRGDPWPPVS